MKVKIGNKIYDCLDEPIMIILTDDDKRMIMHMHPDDYKYCSYPAAYSKEEIENFMKCEEEKIK